MQGVALSQTILTVPQSALTIDKQRPPDRYWQSNFEDWFDAVGWLMMSPLCFMKPSISSHPFLNRAKRALDDSGFCKTSHTSRCQSPKISTVKETSAEPEGTMQQVETTHDNGTKKREGRT
jgi:hypothetical protein